MDTVRVVGGAGTGPTEMAAYDAALADANLHQYNLVHISSIIPAGATVRTVTDAPSLGSPGDRLFVVEARATAGSAVTAGVAWAMPETGSGIVYEAAGVGRDASVEPDLEAGITSGLAIRGLDVARENRDRHVVEHGPPEDGYATAVVLAVFGRGRPILDLPSA